MKYSYVLATLAASAMATPYIAVEVSEPGNLVVENNRHCHGVNRHDNDHDRDNKRRHRGGWLSSFFGHNDEELDEENRRRDQDRHRRNRSRNRRNRNGRNGRDQSDDDDEEDDQTDINVVSCISFPFLYMIC
jgi:hypothetical protein